MERRYVIIDRRKSGDEFIDILDSDITEADAIAKTEDSWAYLTPEEKKQSDMCLAYLAVDERQLVSWDSDGYQEALDRGWDTTAGYTPIITME